MWSGKMLGSYKSELLLIKITDTALWEMWDSVFLFNTYK